MQAQLTLSHQILPLCPWLLCSSCPAAANTLVPDGHGGEARARVVGGEWGAESAGGLQGGFGFLGGAGEHEVHTFGGATT